MVATKRSQASSRSWPRPRRGSDWQPLLVMKGLLFDYSKNGILRIDDQPDVP